MRTTTSSGGLAVTALPKSEDVPALLNTTVAHYLDKCHVMFMSGRDIFHIVRARCFYWTHRWMAQGQTRRHWEKRDGWRSCLSCYRPFRWMTHYYDSFIYDRIMTKYSVSGIEDVIGHHGRHWWMHKLTEFNAKHINPIFTRDSWRLPDQEIIDIYHRYVSSLMTS